MTKDEARKRIAKLKAEINHHRYLYHVLDRQEISDAALDSLKHELQQLEQQSPELLTPDSPSQRVGGQPLDKFTKVTHQVPLLSLQDAFSQKELVDWQERNQKLLSPTEQKNLAYYAEIKLDGLAVALIYEQGLLTRGATRGDGRIGEEVTNNIKTIEAIPLALFLDQIKDPRVRKKASGRVEVRGEVYLAKKDFERLNQEQKKLGQETFANPRNIAAGSVRQLDPRVTSSRKLAFQAYDLVTDLGQTTHQESHELLQLLGFKVNQYNDYCRGLAEVESYHQRIGKIRAKFPYWSDGIVINVNSLAIYRKLGVVGKTPRGGLAYKYPAEQATTVVEDIQVQVGRLGTLTPVAHLQPVSVAGSVVRRATLHNEDQINRLDVRLGDTVIIQKAGDIIPEVVQVLPKLRTGKEKKFHFPQHCPVCGSPVVRRKSEAAYICTSKNCLAQQQESLYHFVGKAAFNIVGLGPKIIDQLLATGLIKDSADLFTLDENDLWPLERFADKKAANLVQAIQASKTIDLARFLLALGIKHIGEQNAIELANHFGSLDKLQSASLEEINGLFRVGDKMAQSIWEFFREVKNLKLLERLKQNGVKVISPKTSPGASQLQGLTFVFTGELSHLSRTEAKKLVRQAGGKATESVSKVTDYVVAGENPGSKFDQAKRLGVKIISEEQFEKLVKNQ